jgi:hypothetical protein
VEGYIQRGERFTWIDERIPNINGRPSFKANNGNLADARRVRIRGFNVYRKKAIRSQRARAIAGRGSRQ